MNSRQHGKKRHTGPHHRGKGDGSRKPPQWKIDKEIDKENNQKRFEEALALSQQLRHLSSQKHLKECIELYHSPANDELRDAHHGSIVVDCCARCGDIDEAERIVHGMLQSRNAPKKEEVSPYFWGEYKQISYEKVPIQAWTALLKGYAHSGLMAKADSLFHYLCSTPNSTPEDGGEGGAKRKRKGADNGVNVRTLNTLLRGCLWTAASLSVYKNVQSIVASKNENKLVGGVATAERAWSLSDADARIDFDSSSYEYFISVLSQSLQCKRAEGCLKKMRKQFGIPDRSSAGKDEEVGLGEVDPTLIESLVVGFVGIARAYALLGKAHDMQRCAEEALYYLDAIDANGGSSGPSSSQTSNKRKKTTGGKKAWKGVNSDSRNDDGHANETGRREESNKLFRNHRLSELRSELSSLQNLCFQSTNPSSKEEGQEDINTNTASYAARMMLTRLHYFSGGGTTGKDATITATASVKANVEEATQQRIHSLWHSFGLKEVVRRLLDEEDHDESLKRIFQSASTKKKAKKQKGQLLPSLLSPKVYASLTANIVGKGGVLSTVGHIDFTHVFQSLNAGIQQNRGLHIELGAGSGDWAALQAQLNPSDDYVTVELRADRVAQTFSKCLLNRQQAGEQKESSALSNLCCVGSECGSFLRDRVEPGTVETVFVNHPEPPTQTFNVSTTNDDGSGKPTNENVLGTEEPAHMLCTQTILSAASCLKPHGKGRLIIVTDNPIYARLICQTVVRVLEKDSKLASFAPSEVQDLRRIETFGRSSVHLYEGKPSLSIGHHIPHSNFDGGTSYFDRLWRTGAGKHADMKRRFIIALQTSGGSNDCGGKEAKSGEATQPEKAKTKSPKPTQPEKAKSKGPKPAIGEGNDSSKKRSDEKKRRRNERRLLKKQQQAQSEKE